MATTSIANSVTYYKRYRMELDLVAPLPPVPALPDGFAWIAWEERLLMTHAEVKCLCFRDELDGVVFPNLANRAGCERLMRDIANRIGFRPQSTWLIAHGEIYVATVQGVAPPCLCATKFSAVDAPMPHWANRAPLDPLAGTASPYCYRELLQGTATDCPLRKSRDRHSNAWLP